MDITEVKVFPIRKGDDKLKAFVTLTLDECFIIRDLKVIQGHTGLFVAMPSRRKQDGSYVDIAHPLNQETRDQLERAILEEYERTVRSMDEDSMHEDAGPETLSA